MSSELTGVMAASGLGLGGTAKGVGEAMGKGMECIGVGKDFVDVAFMSKVGIVMAKVDQIEDAKTATLGDVVQGLDAKVLHKVLFVMDDDMDIKVNGFAKIGYASLPAKVKAMIHQEVAATLPNDEVVMEEEKFAYKNIAWAYVCKETYSNYMPLFYSKIKVVFQIIDLDFSRVAEFVTSLPSEARFALLNNQNLRLNLSFTDDDITDATLARLEKWIDLCYDINRLVSVKPFSGVRIPWQYTAHDMDIVAHVNTEEAVRRWTRVGELEAEYAFIKNAFKNAPAERRARLRRQGIIPAM